MFRPVSGGLGQGSLQRWDIILCGLGQFIGGVDLNAGEVGIHVLRNRRLDQLLLLLVAGLGDDQVLLVRRQFGFGAYHLDGRQRADLDLALVVSQ